MWTKLFVLLSLACVALGKYYPPGVSASVCPNYPVCDAYMLSRFTLDGQPIPEWMNTPSVLPVEPIVSHLGYRTLGFGGLEPTILL